MIRLSKCVWAAFVVLAVCGQGQDVAPILVQGRIVAILPVQASEFGLVTKVQNTSTRDIKTVVLRVTFSNPTNGQKIGRSFRLLGDDGGKGFLLKAGTEVDLWQKPMQIPNNSFGAGVQFSIVVDLVVFGDGSKWGPATLGVSQKILAGLN